VTLGQLMDILEKGKHHCYPIGKLGICTFAPMRVCV
jgi:hypothetical protein